MAMQDRVCVGAIAGAFGVKGEVRLKSFCADPEAIATYGPLLSEDGKSKWDIKLTRPVKNGFAAKLSGVLTKDAADALRGVRLYAPRDRLPSLPEDEFYYTDLIGMAVFDTGGVELGRVKAVLNHGAGDLLEISGSAYRQPLLIPFSQTAVPTVDTASRRVIIDPPDGALPEIENE